MNEEQERALLVIPQGDRAGHQRLMAQRRKSGCRRAAVHINTCHMSIVTAPQTPPEAGTG